MKIRLSDDDSQFWALKVSLVTITKQSYNTDVGLTDQSTTEYWTRTNPTHSVRIWYSKQTYIRNFISRLTGNELVCSDFYDRDQ